MSFVKRILLGGSLVAAMAFANSASAVLSNQLIFSPLQCIPANAYAENNLIRTAFSVKNRGDRQIILLCPLVTGYPDENDGQCGSDYTRHELFVQFVLKPAISRSQAPAAWLSSVAAYYNPDSPNGSNRRTRGQTGNINSWNGSSTHFRTNASPSIDCGEISEYSSFTARVRLPAAGEITYIRLIKR